MKWPSTLRFCFVLDDQTYQPCIKDAAWLHVVDILQHPTSGPTPRTIRDTIRVSNGSGWPASGPVFSYRFGSVWSQTRPKTRPALSWRGSYPAQTWTNAVLAGVEPPRGSILWFLPQWLNFGPKWVSQFTSYRAMINMETLQYYALFHLPLLVLWSDQYCFDHCEIRPNMKPKSRVFDRESTNIGLITFLKGGCESAHRTAQFTYWSCHDTIWTQILNWSQPWDVEILGSWW